jgi:hypothetical protein
MSDPQAPIRVSTTGPAYLGWRGELLAELALARVPEFIVLKSDRDVPFDFVVTTKDGLCFFVEVKAYSSLQLNRAPEKAAALQLRIDSEVLRKARKSLNPVIAFLVDADRDHGRFLRLDTQPEPAQDAESVLLTFPIENTITASSLKNLASQLEKERLVRVGA